MDIQHARCDKNRCFYHSRLRITTVLSRNIPKHVRNCPKQLRMRPEESETVIRSFYFHPMYMLASNRVPLRIFFGLSRAYATKHKTKKGLS